MAQSLSSAAQQALGMMQREMLSEDPHWPDGAVVIPSDLPEFGAALARAVEQRAPFVLVFPDGQEIVFQPSPHPVAVDEVKLVNALKMLRKLGPLTSPEAPINLHAFGISVAATSSFYEPPIAA